MGGSLTGEPPSCTPKYIDERMLFFSNRLGCLISLLISVVGTLLILVLLGWVRV
jgi:hypothetical protein